MSPALLSLTISPHTELDRERLERGLSALSAEDPTLHVSVDPGTGTTVVGTMGELHMEIVVDRLAREFGVSASVSVPRVVYKESRFAQMTFLLEPVMRVVVTVPRLFLDAVIADLGERRGRVRAIDEREGMQVVTAQVPLAWLFGYAMFLRDCTRGRGTFTMSLDRYEPVG